MNCQNCGAPVADKAVICVKCGVSLVGSKSWFVTFLLCLFLGLLGFHRFYTGHRIIGILQLFSLGGGFIWLIVDFISILLRTYKDSDGHYLV